MHLPPAIHHTTASLREALAAYRAEKKRIALVPSMGALHAGHASLMKLARAHADCVVASIFVNPTQFNDQSDFTRYPRTLDADMEVMTAACVDLAYVPGVDDVYPQGFASSIHVGGVSEGLEGVHRPGHFDGVATVVAKLLAKVMPDVAIFGEKDYQQLMVIRRLVSDLDLPVEIIAAPIMREADGLAMSSRNVHLSADERRIAAALPATLTRLAEQIPKQKEPLARLLEQGEKDLLHAGFKGVDYLTLCEADSLRPLSAYQGENARLLVAARLGTIRLLDNMAVNIS